MEKTGILDLFEAVIDGNISKEIGLKGKPHPDIFLVTAGNLGIHPNECLMVEDSISGVKAGRNGNFALVIGYSRNGNRYKLQTHGADIIVENMLNITLQDIEIWFREGIKDEGWNLTYYGFEPREEKLRETLTTIGNGYFGTRGCFESEKAFDDVHYPGTYLAGVYNTLPSIIHHKKIYNNDFVNCPNWLLLEIKIGDADFIHLLDTEILHYKHTLNFKEAIMGRSITFKDKEGRITTIDSARIACMHDPHFGALKYTITPVNYSEKITLKSSLDGSVINYGVPRYRELNNKHLSPINAYEESGAIGLIMQTNNSKVTLYVTAKTSVYQDNIPLKIKKTVSKRRDTVSETISIDAQQGISYRIEKFVSLYTTRDLDTDNPEKASKKALKKITTFDQALKKHKKVWEDLWNKADIVIEGDRFSQKVVRLHIYHLLATACIHNKYIDAGMPARGLHGEAYRGHIFWDELFILPFFNLRFPEISKALLMYRYRRLDAAREYARQNGYEGAMYPWQTADDGMEETQSIHFNPLSGKWDPDLSRKQRHVSFAIAYNIWEYYYCTNDLEFLHNYGAEVMIEIARFWASIATYDEKNGRFHIKGIMGPDEFHEKYPEADEPGINDNAYTNIMVSWLLHKTIKTVQRLPEKVINTLSEKINFTMKEIDKWKKIVSKMNVVISDQGLVAQFDGFMDLKEINWEQYRKKYHDLHRMDRILKAEGDFPDKYQLAKQADVLMTFYLLSPGQVKHILDIMGFPIQDDKEFMRKNYEYYVKRTSHGSTLSLIVHSAILKYLSSHKKDMWKWFFHALKSDIYDTQGGTTAEGIHCGVMAGTLDIIIKSFAGINIFKDYIKLTPNLPAHWHKLSFKILHRNNLLDIEVTKDAIKINRLTNVKKRVGVKVGDKNYNLDNHFL